MGHSCGKVVCWVWGSLWGFLGWAVLARLMESQIWPASSVALPAFLSGRKLSPSSCNDTSQFSFPCMPLVPFNLLPQCWSAGVSLNKFVCGLFKTNCSGLQHFLLLTESLLVFALEVMGPCLPGTGTLGWVALCVPVTLHSQDTIPKFLSTTPVCGTSPSVSPPLLPI